MKARFLASLSLLVFSLPHAGCDNQQSGTQLGSGIVGQWIRHTPAGDEVRIEFAKDGSFGIWMESVDNAWPGTYSLSKDLVRVVDRYCGTKFPGVYRVVYKNDSLHFTPVDEPVCDRVKYLGDRPYARIKSQGKSIIPPL